MIILLKIINQLMKNVKELKKYWKYVFLLKDLNLIKENIKKKQKICKGRKMIGLKCHYPNGRKWEGGQYKIDRCSEVLNMITNVTDNKCHKVNCSPGHIKQ